MNNADIIKIRDTLFCRSINGNNHLRVAAFAEYLDKKFFEESLEELEERYGVPEDDEEYDIREQQAAQWADAMLQEVDPRLSDLLSMKFRLQQAHERVKEANKKIDDVWKSTGRTIANHPLLWEAKTIVEKCVEEVAKLQHSRDENKEEIHDLKNKIYKLSNELDKEWGAGLIGDCKPIW